MKLQFRTLACGPDFRANPGDVIDVADELALDLVAGGYAFEIVDPDAAPAAAYPQW